MMTKTLTDLLLIAIIIVSITDISGFFQHMEGWLSKKVGGDIHLKILECSGCQMTWSGFTWLLLTHSFTLQTMAMNLVIAWVFVPVIGDALILIKEIFGKIIRLIYKLIDD